MWTWTINRNGRILDFDIDGFDGDGVLHGASVVVPRVYISADIDFDSFGRGVFYSDFRVERFAQCIVEPKCASSALAGAVFANATLSIDGAAASRTIDTV